MATSDSENVPESSSSHYRRSASPEVVCFSEPEIMPENNKTTIKGAQHDGYHKAWKRKNALKKKKRISDTGPSKTGRESFNNGGSFKRSNSNPDISLHQGGEGEGVDEQQPRQRGVQFLQVPPLSNRHLVRRSAAGVSHIQPSPLVTSSLTYCSNMNETDGGMELVPELYFRQYHLDVDSADEDDDNSSNEEEEEVDEELEGQELERQEFEEELMNPSFMPPNPPIMHTDTRKISGVSLTGYQGDEEVLSQDNRWLRRPSDDAGMTQLHSQELLNELFFKFKYVRSSLKHHGRRRTFRKHAATESTGKISARDMMQKKNSGAIINIDHSLSKEEEEEKELEKKKEEERKKARRASMQVDFSLYDTKKKKKERKVSESIGVGASLSPPQKKTKALRTLSVPEFAGPTSINKYKPSSPNLSLFDRKKLPVSPKAPHFTKLKLHNPKSAEKLRKHLEMKKYDQVQRNERMDTPIHAIVRSDRKDKLECLMALMVYSDYGTENIDVPTTFGNSALHIAVQKGDLSMVRLLLVFGANIDAINDKKRTPLDMLINRGNDEKFSNIIEELKRLDAKHGQEVVPVRREKHHSTRLVSISTDLPERQEKFTDCRQNQRFESIGMGIEKRRALSIDGLSPTVIAQKLETNLNELYEEYDRIHNLDMQMAIGLQQFELFGWKKTSSSAMKFNVHGGSRILFLDGGGIRGLIQIEIMSIIEQRTGRTITELFDWIVGTSTGGIVALGLVYGKKTLAELRQFYFKLKNDVFSSQGIGGIGGFNTEELERILKEVLGTEMRMSDIKEPKVLISAVNKSTTSLQLNFFNNCFDDEFSNEIVWKVARYTSAAPGYFSECDDYVDGGVLANNPNDYGLTAIQNFHRQKGRKLDIACVVSVGNGIFPAIKLGSTDTHKLISVKAFGNLITLLTKALVESEDVAMNCKSRCEEQHIPFFRFSPHLDTEVASGETDNDRLIDMILQTKYQAVEEWDDKLEDLAYIFSRIEEYSRKQMLQKLRDRRRLRTMNSQNDVIPEEQ